MWELLFLSAMNFLSFASKKKKEKKHNPLHLNLCTFTPQQDYL
jgi:hypothetical protein